MFFLERVTSRTAKSWKSLLADFALKLLTLFCDPVLQFCDPVLQPENIFAIVHLALESLKTDFASLLLCSLIDMLSNSSVKYECILVRGWCWML